MPAKKTLAQHLEEARIRHNGKYDYSRCLDLPKGVHTSIAIVCPTHGQFSQKLYSHKAGLGCPHCSPTRPKTKEEYISRFVDVHGTTYDYGSWTSLEFQATTEIPIICRRHGLFYQSIRAHYSGGGCQLCAGNLHRTKDSYVAQFNDVHDNEYDYTEWLADRQPYHAKSPISITCVVHGVFTQHLNNHLRGSRCPKCASNGPSRGEREIAEYITTLGFSTESTNRHLIAPYHLDIVVHDKELAIEYNGVIWHSEGMGRGSSYHLNKTVGCLDIGYTLLHVFDFEWNEKQNAVKSLLSSRLGTSDLISADDLSARVLTPDEARPFFDACHIRGHVDGLLYIGLVDDSTVLAAAVFGKPERDLTFQWELLQFVNALHITVVGGLSKMLCCFNREASPSSIVAFADRRYSTGNTLKQAGFTFVENTAPSYHCFAGSNSSNTLFPEGDHGDRGLESRLEHYDSAKTEWQNMQDNGYDRVWDCGHSKWAWYAPIESSQL